MERVTEDKTVFENKLKLTAKKAALLFSLRVLALFLGFIANIIYGRALGANLYGVYQQAWTLISSLSLFTVFGMNFSLIRFIPIYEIKNEYLKIRQIISFSFAFSFGVSLVLGFILTVERKLIALRIFEEALLIPILPIFSIILIMNSLFILAGGVIQAKKEAPIFIFFKELLNRISKIIFFLLLLVLLRNKLLALSWSTLISSVIILFFSLSWLKKTDLFVSKSHFLSLKFKDIKEFFKYSFNFLFINFTYFFMGEINRLIIGIFVVSKEVGLYAIAEVISLLVLFVLVAFNSIFAPIISELYHSRKLEVLNNMYIAVTRLVWIFTLPIFLWIVVFNQDVLQLFGPDFVEAEKVLIFLAIGQFINAIAGPNGFMLSMSGHQKWEMINGIIVAILNLFLNILLIPRFGALGSAIAGAIALAVINILKTIEVWFIMRMIPYNRKFLKPLLAGAIGWMVLSGLKKYLSPGFARLGISALTGLFVILGVIYILGLEEEDRLLLNAIKKKILDLL